MALPEIFRLKKRAQFLRVYNGGETVNTRHFVMYVLCDQTETRFGFTVSRKIGKAVVRNRVRRRLAEIVYRNLDRFPEGRWWVFNTKRASAQADYQILEADLVAAVNRYVETRGPDSD